MYKTKLFPEHELLIQGAEEGLLSKPTSELKQLIKKSTIKINKLRKSIKKSEAD